MLKLESVGTIVDKDGVCYPMMFKDGKPDLDVPCPIMDTENDEWFESLSMEDFISLFDFLEDNNVDIPIDWKRDVWGIWEEANNCYLNMETK